MTKTEIFNLGEISAVTLRMGQLPTDCSMRIFSQFLYRMQHKNRKSKTTWCSLRTIIMRGQTKLKNSF